MESLWRHHPYNNNDQAQGSATDTKSKNIKKAKYRHNTLIVYHLDVSSCISSSMNTFLFELLFLQHINATINSQCFHVNPNMAFLIEIPSQLNGVEPICAKILHTVFSVSSFPVVHVTQETNPYIFGPEAKFSIKWMKEFYAEHLKFPK
ncbi:hypothetical protein RFI_34941 [Reticulomyxa filosa]|uniref:Uncharacterized protein n=1 Tax=Reticulomyxa filosa TaxID=46433 RepID=X6LLK4_RETFI|nr:hypothetical protein RFI_34941 [Reticulomyxa filosa]|eukprot:ETO02489.1 hypothetical protein RFI_34941 [Reticulomyxa filosa]